MPSEVISINTPDDLAKLNGWMIDSLRYDVATMQIIVEVHNILAPNKVRLRIGELVSFSFGQKGIIHYGPMFIFNTEDIPNEK